MLSGGPSISLDTSLRILNIAKQAYPATVLGLFILLFVIYGIRNAPDEGDQVTISAVRGPGGRPLPFRRPSAKQVKQAAAIRDFSPTAKLIFRLGQTGIILTFIVDAAIILFQVVIYRKDQWWPGQSAVVRKSSPLTHPSLTSPKGIRDRVFLRLDRCTNKLDRHCPSSIKCPFLRLASCSTYRMFDHWGQSTDL